MAQLPETHARDEDLVGAPLILVSRRAVASGAAGRACPATLAAEILWTGVEPMALAMPVAGGA